MTKRNSRRQLALFAVQFLWLISLCAAPVVYAQGTGAARGATPEQRAASFFESLRKSPPQQFAFLLAMPKGADLHNHLSGAIYAESFIQWAAEKGLCVNTTTFALTQTPCEPNAAGLAPMTSALTNGVLYRQLIDAWSMRNWEYSGQNGHDHFFDTFGKFGPATYDQGGRMLAEEVARAARGHLLYLELMLTPDNGLSGQLGQSVGWNGNLQGTLDKLKAAGIAKAVSQGIENIQTTEKQKNELLKCGTPQADPGCSVTVRYVFQVSRGAPLGTVYAQMLAGFMLASDPQSKVVALNLVQPEDSLPSMQNFSTQMQMLDFLHNLYPAAHITLHAGELAPGMVPPDGLSFHIRSSVLTGHAERIGHGVDIMHEVNPYELLRELARRNVMIEICLTSNDVILGVRGKDHPLLTYMQYGVPVALATDDEGVSRSEISREYLKAAIEQELGYLQLKTMARTSLQFAFIPGASLWTDAKTFRPASQCANDRPGQNASKTCQQFLAANEKARLQWELEKEFKDFESKY
ncbi:MAG: adenosine deaminase [Pyrinomonadaceae bacterium]|nr:adenosine deaminase [Pyrinomonadaceae bacterium]